MEEQLLQEIEKMWQRYSQYKETAEQHEFVDLLIFDNYLIAQYEDIQRNYAEDRAKILIKNLKFVFNKLGIMYEEDI